MKKLFLSSLIIVALGLIASPAYAALFESGCEPSALPEKGGCGWTEFFSMVNKVINFLIYVIGFPLAGLLTAWGGFVILTSGGSPEKVSQGRKIITGAVIGLAIALASYLIIATVIQTIVPIGGIRSFLPIQFLP